MPSGYKNSLERIDGASRRFLTQARVRRFSLVWISASFILCCLNWWRQTELGLADRIGHPFGDDFINYWSGAKLALEGRAGVIYDLQAFHAFEQSVAQAPIFLYHYSYPPVMPLFTLPLALFPYVPALFVWLVATWVVFYLGLRAARPGMNPLLLSLAWPAVFFTVMAGQNGMLTAALLGGGLTVMPRRPVIAGILFGLLCFKPQMGFLIPVALIAGRQWKTFVSAALTSVFLIGLSLALYGTALWIDYFHAAALLRHFILEDGSNIWFRFSSVFVTARELGIGVAASYILQALCAFLAVAIIVQLWRRPAPHEVRCAALVMGTLMSSPYVLDYDLTVTCFVAIWLSRCYRQYHVAVAALALMPVVSTVLGNVSGVGVAPLMMMPACLLILSSCHWRKLPKRI